MIDADAAMFEYMLKQMVSDIWPNNSRFKDKITLYSTISDILVGLITHSGNIDVTQAGWNTESAIKSGINRRLTSSKVHNSRIGIGQVRSLLQVAISEGTIARQTVSYAMRPDSITFYRLSPKYFNHLIELLNKQHFKEQTMRL